MNGGIILDIFFNIKPRGINFKHGIEKIIREYIAKNKRLPKEVDECAFYSLNVVFYLNNIRQRIDIDNMLKGICDSFNGVIFKDDWQIMEIRAKKEHSSFLKGFSIQLTKFFPSG